MTGTKIGILRFTSSDVGTSVTGIKFIKHFRWVSATGSGHKCVVKAASGDSAFESEADGEKFIDVHPLYKFMNGITIDTLDSGVLYVYLA
jgi:hypothetical protein